MVGIQEKNITFRERDGKILPKTLHCETRAFRIKDGAAFGGHGGRVSG
jgi:hypothetical protein